MGPLFWPRRTVICRLLGLPGSYPMEVRSCGWRKKWLGVGCTMSSRTETGDTQRKDSHQYCRGRIGIYLELQEDLAVEGCGRRMGYVVAQNCPWGCACCRGWFTVLRELSIVNAPRPQPSCFYDSLGYCWCSG